MRIPSIGMSAVMVLTVVGFGPGRSAATTGVEALRLPKPLSEYTRDRYGAEEFLAWTRKRHWNGHERDRKCDPRERCNGNEATLIIEEAEGAEKLAFNSYTGTEVLVGRVENTGTKKDFLFGDYLPPDPKAEGFIFLSPQNNKAYPHFVVLSFDTNGVPHLDDKGYGRDPFHRCDTDGPSHKTEADFKDCKRLNRPGATDSLVRIQEAADGVAWFSCAEGCCGSSFPPFSRKGRKPRVSKARPKPNG